MGDKDNEKDDNFLGNWFDVIKSTSNVIKCFNCGTKIDMDDALWSHMPGRGGRITFCNKECKLDYVKKEIQYHEDMAAELQVMRKELEGI